MPKTLQTLFQASRPHLKQQRQATHIWISEELLTETYNNFIHRQKRHGSSVPGPLEARKRAAKRRSTTVTYGSSGAFGFDPSERSEVRSEESWWKGSECADETAAAKPWSWRFTLPAWSAKSVRLEQAQKLEDEESRQKDAARRRWTYFQWSLKRIHRHESLLNLMEECRVDFTGKPDLAHTLFQHILDSEWTSIEVAEFLVDPTVNPPGSGNHVLAFEDAKSCPTRTQELLSSGVFFKAARLGLVDVLDLQQIFLLLPDLEPSIFPAELDWTLLCVHLLDAVEESNVVSLADFGMQFVTDWITFITKHEIQQSTPVLLYRLHQFLGQPPAQALEVVVCACMSTVHGKAKRPLRHLIAFMQGLPDQLLSSVILSVTQRFVPVTSTEGVKVAQVESWQAEVVGNAFLKQLVAETTGYHDTMYDYTQYRAAQVLRESENENTTNSTPYPGQTWLTHRLTLMELYDVAYQGASLPFRESTMLELWYAVLCGIGSPKGSDAHRFVLTLKAWEDYLNTSPSSVQSRKRAVTGLWVVTALCTYDEAAVREIGIAGLHTLITRRFAAAEHAGEEDLLANIIDSLRIIDLPGKTKLLRRTAVLCNYLVTVNASHRSLFEQDEALQAKDIELLENYPLYVSVRRHFPAGLKNLSQSINQDLAQTEASLCKAIEESPAAIKIVIRLIRHNQQLHLALNRAGQLMLSGSWRWNNHHKAKVHALGGYTYKQVVNMMNNIAWSCAISEQMSATNAFGKIFFILKLLQTHHAPILPTFVEALWHAGIDRRVNTSKKFIDFVHKIAEQYVGKKGVERLLQRSAIRARFQDAEYHQRKKLEAREKLFNDTCGENAALNSGIDVATAKELLASAPGGEAQTRRTPAVNEHLAFLETKLVQW